MPRARKSGSTRARAGSSAPSTAGDAKSRLIAAAFDLAQSKGWRTTGMGDIARAANLPLDQAYAAFPTKIALLAGFARQINATVLGGGEAEGSSREKLFDLLMRRFDALKPHRAALKVVIRDSIGDPAVLCGAPVFLGSMGWTLEAAGISTAGWCGPARVLALTAAYGLVFRTFLDDDSEDLAKTMAALDRRLKAARFGRDEPSPAAATG